MENAKRTVIFVLCMICVTVFIACGKEGNKEEYVLEVESEDIVYNVSRGSICTVDEAGTLYAIVSEYVRDEEGFLLDENYVLSAYDLEGNLTEEYMLDKSLEMIPDKLSDNRTISSIVVKNGVLYAVSDNAGVLELYSYDITAKTEEKLYVFERYTEIERLVPMDGKVYFIGLDEAELGKEYNGTDKAEYYRYEGEVFGYISIKNKSKTVIGVDFPISISAMPDSNIMVYAYDDNEGYYFAKYNEKKNVVEIIEYADYGDNLFFTLMDKENHFLYMNRQLGIVCASPDKTEGEAVIIPKYAGTEIYYVGGQLFYTNGERRMPARISLKGKVKWNLPIKAIYSEYIHSKPFGCGYIVDAETLEAEAFALRVLAQDKDFDVCLLDSSKDVAANIKKNGVFYPLNEVEGVMEYIDACFPYIKEAALTDEGEVWMVPVYVEVDTFVYDKKVFEEYGITTEMVADFDGFTKITDRFARETDLRMNVWYASLKNALMDQYLSKYTSLDTQLFRKTVEILLNRCNSEDSGYIDSYLLNDISHGKVEQFLYTENLASAIISDSSLGDATDYGIIPMPLIEKGIKNQARCVMMSVNPDSENLENTLNYISEYAKYMLEQRNTFILSDLSTYDDTVLCKGLYDCYADAEISFRISSDIFQDNLYAYLDKKITLEEFIAESERKIEVYLNE